MKTSESFNWLIIITFSIGLIMFVLVQIFYNTCESILDDLLTWRIELGTGLNSNWTGWQIDFEKYIGECHGYQTLVDMDLR